MNAQDLMAFLMDQELEHSGVVAEQLAASNFLVLGDARLVRDAGFGELTFGRPTMLISGRA